MKPFGASISRSRSCGVSAETTEELETERVATLAFALPREAAGGGAAVAVVVESFESKMPLGWTLLIELMMAERCAGEFAL